MHVRTASVAITFSTVAFVRNQSEIPKSWKDDYNSVINKLFY